MAFLETAIKIPRAVAKATLEAPAHFLRSFFRVGYPDTIQRRLAIVVSTWALHIHPTRVHRHSIRPTFTFGLGVITFFLFVILGVTGVYLMFYYEPSTQAAYARMQDLGSVVTFGRVMRNLHRWAAEAMVACVVLHMCRVFYTGAYKPPREFNWVVGVLLLLLTLALSFTGYLLPWDQLSFWAITVGTNIISYAPFLGLKLRFLLLGGDTVGSEALLRFYTLHVALLPAIATPLIGYHFWRIRKDGGLARPPEKPRLLDEEGEEPQRKDTVYTFPLVLYIELLIFLVLMAGLLVASLLFNAPLEAPADPLQPTNPSKAPWYFLGLQELVSYSAFWGGFIVPLVLTLFLLVLPYLDRSPHGIGSWFARQRVAIVVIWSIILAGILATTTVGVFFRGPNWNFYWPWRGWPGPG